MAEFFDKFPRVKYNLKTTGGRRSEYDFPMNILVRIGFYSEIFNNIFLYYDYVIKDTDKPEILAEKYYKDPEAHWVILLSNKMMDPFYDWPLRANEFDMYLKTKYGSISSAKTRVQRYEKIVKSVDGSTKLETTRTYEISQDEYSYLPDSDPTGEVRTLPNGNTVTIYTYRNLVYVYDYEFLLNESKRNIKLIKAEYYPIIKQEFDTLMSKARGEFVASDVLRRI